MRRPLAINAAAACFAQAPPVAAAHSSGPKRRGVTAMEYCVMLSFILAVLVMAVQHIGALVSPSFNKASVGNTGATTGGGGSGTTQTSTNGGTGSTTGNQGKGKG